MIATRRVRERELAKLLPALPAKQILRVEEGREEAREWGRRSLALVFELRGLQPTAAEQARVDECTDLDALARWVERAKTARAVADVFD
jgi:hypothetical protein